MSGVCQSCGKRIELGKNCIVVSYGRFIASPRLDRFKSRESDYFHAFCTISIRGLDR